MDSIRTDEDNVLLNLSYRSPLSATTVVIIVDRVCANARQLIVKSPNVTDDSRVCHHTRPHSR